MPPSALEISQLTKTIGNGVAIQALNLKIDRGKRVALLGRNGAGKTSFLKLLVGDTAADSGEINYTCTKNNHCQPYDMTFKNQMGYQADTMLSLMEMNGFEYLSMAALLKNISYSKQQEKLNAIQKLWPLHDILATPMRQLSKGNLQKLAIAQVFINSPQFLFFDEPCQSLDPLEQEKFNHLLRQQEDFQLCVFSTHNVEHALAVADDIILIEQSKIVIHFKASEQQQYVLSCHLALTDLAEIEDKNQVKITPLTDRLYRLEMKNKQSLAKFEKYLKLQYPEAKMVDFLLPYREAIMPLFRRIASGEFDFKGVTINNAEHR